MCEDKQHAKDLKEAMENYPHARKGKPVPISERFGPDFMDGIEDCPTVIGEYPFSGKDND